MRVDTAALDPFLTLMQRYRPCPTCGSARVTIQRLGSGDAGPLRASCADCGASHVTLAVPDLGQSTTPGDT
jgi:hypothetical protein